MKTIYWNSDTPVAKFNNKKDVKIYEVDLDALPKKNLVWKSK